MNLILEQLTVLQPALNSRSKAEQLLTDYWADKIALVWTSSQVHRAANEVKTVLTEAQARQLLNELHQAYAPQFGLDWETLSEHLQRSGLGRDITARELHRFIHTDVLMIDPAPNSKNQHATTPPQG